MKFSHYSNYAIKYLWIGKKEKFLPFNFQISNKGIQAAHMEIDDFKS